MKTLLTYTTLIDLSLTPRNAKTKGYHYVDDVIYDEQNPSIDILDVLDFASQFHCKLGTPTLNIDNDPYYGFYIPQDDQTV
jgi:hypothetical protein